MRTPRNWVHLNRMPHLPIRCWGEDSPFFMDDVGGYVSALLSNHTLAYLDRTDNGRWTYQREYRLYDNRFGARWWQVQVDYDSSARYVQDYWVLPIEETEEI